METTIFGMNEAQLTEFGMSWGLAFLMLFIVFIVGNLAWKSKAGKTGTFALFLALTLGLVGFLAKFAIQHYLNIH
ncbi:MULTISPECIES: DUF2788 domain-containing protein [unclassified Methylophilus]|jgi:hypothetical protein|uniref:DUF2788 domain-containing protein n=1 Tax=Methylophilus glucosoxydans TaxID=752553 RepID=A0ABW3GE48_9PROT|nr:MULTISPECIES: DUF2788 domain-containing protein [unclassified Methylophilus]MBF5040119.1 DUF2788 domain-containing protein [Methylophilus sp. 13]MDF0378101.1 DUF2788 domain-containing protein [Methylophilus sp. YYY-1]MDT7850464.1 DUF2788 domain-containing protein [Methylophilus sp. VKM B-3414]BEV07091.1 DUF2788 domain-containing protein [Methylophilus sp. DW102]